MTNPKIFCLIAMLLLMGQISAQTQDEQILNPGSVSGRVLIEGKPAKNVSIGIFSGRRSLLEKPRATARTDDEGIYTLENIAPGTYYIDPEVPGFVLEAEEKLSIRKLVFGNNFVLEAGENLKYHDINLVRGSVITGRVTDAKGMPIIGGEIKLEKVDDTEKTYESIIYDFGMLRTDDRGIYRIYGLSAGKYIVSFGINDRESGIADSNSTTNKKTYYPLVFYPSVIDKKSAKIVEIGIGDEAVNIDMRTGEKGSTFNVAGKLIAEDTGMPLNSDSIYIIIQSADDSPNYNTADSRVKSDGIFDVSGLLPGKYRVDIRVSLHNSSDYIVPTTLIEITDSDIENLEIKAKKGLSISGKVVIENTSMQRDPVDLSSLGLSFQGENVGSYNFSNMAKVNADGTFTLKGCEPGEFSIYSMNRSSGLSVGKLKSGGVLVKNVNLKKGKSIENLEVLLIYGSISLKGEIRVSNGELPSDMTLLIDAKPLEQGRIDSYRNTVDQRGKFIIEGLPSGEYEISVTAYVSGGGFGPIEPIVKKRLMLINGVDGQITFDINSNQFPTK